MVPGDDPVVKSQHQVRQREVVEPGRRQPLERTAEIVGDEPGQPALKGRQPGHRFGAVCREQIARLLQRPHTLPLSLAPQHRRRGGHQVGVPAQPLGVRGAIQQQQVRLAQQPGTGLNRIGAGYQLLDQ